MSEEEIPSSNPNLSVIFSFLRSFGTKLFPDKTSESFTLSEIEKSVRSPGDPGSFFVSIVIKLLRRLRKTVRDEKWEKAALSFLNSHSSYWSLQEIRDISRAGFKDPDNRILLLKILLEAQFDVNSKFKNGINALTASDLRLQPVGKDRKGNAYWIQTDESANLRIYKEDIDDETWELIATTKEQFLSIIQVLENNDTFISKKNPDEEGEDEREDFIEEDSMGGFENIIRDTAPSAAPSQAASLANSSDDEEMPMEKTRENEDKKSFNVEVIDEKVSNSILKPSSESVQSVEQSDSSVKFSDLPVISEPPTNLENEPMDVDENITNKKEKVDSDDGVSNIKKSRETFELYAPSEEKNSENETTYISIDKNVSNKSTIETSESKIEKTGSEDHKVEHTTINKAVEPTDTKTISSNIDKISKTSNPSFTDSIDNNKIPKDIVEDKLKVSSESIEYNNKTSNEVDLKDHISEKTSDSEISSKPFTDEVTAKCVDKEVLPYIDDKTSEASVELKIEKPDILAPETKPEEKIEKEDISSKALKDEAPESNPEPLIENIVQGTSESSAAKNVKPTLEKSPGEETKTSESVVKSSENEILSSEPPTDRSQTKENLTEASEGGINESSDIKMDTNEKDISDETKESQTSEKLHVTTPPPIVNEKNELNIPSDKSVCVNSSLPKHSVEFLTSKNFISPSELKKNDNAIVKTSNYSIESLAGTDSESGKKRGLDNPDDESSKKIKLDSVSEEVEGPSLLISGNGQGSANDAGNNGDLNGNGHVENECMETEDAPDIKVKSPGLMSDDECTTPSNNMPIRGRGKSRGSRGRARGGLKVVSEKPVDIPSPRPTRSSGRIASLRIKEAERRQREEEDALIEFKENQKKKDKKVNDESSEESDFGEEKKTGKKRKRKKKKKGDKEFGKFSSGSDSAEDKLDEDDIEEEEDDNQDNLFKSDHEFSCESDVPENEVTPVKLARTARKKRAAKVESITKEDDEKDDFACKKCNKSDHPEWILLCDTEGCDVGWHASCLRPALMVIPEGNWYCPDCQHNELLVQLKLKLKEFEGLERKKEADDKRKERLAFVNMSLSNIIPSPPKKSSKKKRVSSSESESSDDDNYSQRRRAARNVNYNMKEYDQIIKSAIADQGEEEEGKKPISAAAISAGKQPRSNYDDEEEEEDNQDESDDNARSGVGKGKDISNSDEKPTKNKGRKKKKKLSDLAASDDSSDDGDSGSDYKLSGDEDGGLEDEFEAEEESDISSLDEIPSRSKKSKKSSNRGGPTRRSNRSRKVIYDDDFVIDGSDSEEQPRKRASSSRSKGGSKKKEDSWTETEESELEEDYSPSKSKRKNKKKRSSDSDEESDEAYVPKGKKKKTLTDDDEESDDGFDHRAKKYNDKLVKSKSRNMRGKAAKYDDDSDESEGKMEINTSEDDGDNRPPEEVDEEEESE